MVTESGPQEFGAYEDDVFDISDTYRAQEMALGDAGWNDPLLDAYNHYDAHRLAADDEQTRP